MKNSENSLPRIVFLDAGTLSPDLDLNIFQQFGDYQAYEYTDETTLLERIDDADIIITNKVILNRSTLQKAKNLKLICITATGMNNIDLQAAQEMQVEVKNVTGYSTSSVAQLTMLFALALSSNLKNLTDYTLSGNWCRSPFFTCQNWPIEEIDSKTWGIIGLGAIGRKVASLACAFDCDIQYFSTSGQNENPQYKRVDLTGLLETSDIISIHAPLNDQTVNLLGKKQLELLKENAILINVGRGGIINEDDLLEVLKCKKIKVALDVLTHEPMQIQTSAFEFKNMDNVLLTPHIAWAGINAQKSLVGQTVLNIKSFLEHPKKRE